MSDMEKFRPESAQDTGRRGMLRLGTLIAALTGASAISAAAANAAPGDKGQSADYVPVAEKGAPSGVATLDGTSKLPAAQLPDLAPIVAPGLSTSFVRRWAASTAYTAGDKVLAPSGEVVTARAGFTSAPIFSPSDWWIIQGDTLRISKEEVAGLADVEPVLRAASDYCLRNGIRKLRLPAATMDIRKRWYLDARNKGGIEVIGEGQDTILRHTGGSPDLAIIHALGTDDPKVAVPRDIPAGSTSASFPSTVAATLQTGDCIGFESTLYAFDVNNDAGMRGYASEIRKVAAVSGDVVTFDGPTIWAYNTANSAVVWKMNPVAGIRLRDFVITSSDPMVNCWKGIQIAKARDIHISNVTFRDAGGGLYFYDVIDGTITDVNVDRLPNFSNFRGYGICIAGRSANIDVIRPRGRGTRHVFTTLSDERSGIHWGGPRHVTVVDGKGEAFPGSFTVWDTHPHGYDVSFINCHASGGVPGSGDSCGFQIRSLKTQVINGVARDMGAGGLRMQRTAGNLDVIGGEFAGCKSYGMSLNADARVNGAWIHDNGSTGVILDERAVRARVVNCRIDNNGKASSAYGVHDQTTAGSGGNVIGPGNIIPKSAGQPSSVLSPKNDTIIYGNVLRGYGAGVDGVAGTISGGVVRAQNITD